MTNQMITTTSSSERPPFGRRDLLKSIGAAGAFVAIGGAGVMFETRPAWAASADSNPGTGKDTVIVTVFLRGAADGLNIVNPLGDPDYIGLRPNLGIDAANSTDLDGFFRMNNDAGELAALYHSGQLAIVHAVGSHETTRSHFSAMDNMDRALGATSGGGWLQRGLAASNIVDPSSAYGLGVFPNPSLRGPQGAAPVVPSIDAVRAARDLGSPARRENLLNLHASDPWFATATARGLASTDTILALPEAGRFFDPADYDFSSDAHDTGAGRLGDAARIINADVGVRAITVDLGEWDHHQDEDLRLPVSLSQLSKAVSAFWHDLQAGDTNAAERTCVVVMSEFGRTAKENGANGTDHGHGNIMMVLGAGVAGGQVILADDTWPGLATTSLYEGQDLPVTTDFRDVFAEVLANQYGDLSLSSALSGFAPSPVGLFAATSLRPQLTRLEASVRDYNPNDAAIWMTWPATGAPRNVVGSRVEIKPESRRWWSGRDYAAAGVVDHEFYKDRPNHGVDSSLNYQVRVAWRFADGSLSEWTTAAVRAWS